MAMVVLLFSFMIDTGPIGVVAAHNDDINQYIYIQLIHGLIGPLALARFIFCRIVRSELTDVRRIKYVEIHTTNGI